MLKSSVCDYIDATLVMPNDKKSQYDINKKTAKMSTLSPCKTNKYKYFTGKEILPSDQSRVIEEAKFTYLPPEAALKKQTKTIEEQKNHFPYLR